jgi:hypothetical protein
MVTIDDGKKDTGGHDNLAAAGFDSSNGRSSCKVGRNN